MSQPLDDEAIDSPTACPYPSDLSDDASVTTISPHIEHYLGLTNPARMLNNVQIWALQREVSSEIVTRISQYACQEVDCQIKSYALQLFGRHLHGMDPPIYIQEIRFEPSGLHALLTIDGEVLYRLLDRGLGGVGSERPYRNFSALELGMLDQVVVGVHESLAGVLQRYIPDIQITPIRHENQPQNAIIFPLDEAVCLMVFELEVDSVAGKMTWCLPTEFSKQLYDVMARHDVSVRSLRPFKDRLSSALDQVPVTLSVIGALFHGSLRDLRDLRAGTILPLIGNPLTRMLAVEVNHCVKFHGRVERTEKSLSMRIADRTSQYPWPSQPIGGINFMENQTASRVETSPNEFLDDVPMELSVRIGAVTLPLGEITQLKQGAVIDLQKEEDSPLEILVNGKLIGFGELVIAKGHVGVRLIDISSARDQLDAD